MSKIQKYEKKRLEKWDDTQRETHADTQKNITRRQYEFEDLHDEPLSLGIVIFLSLPPLTNM